MNAEFVKSSAAAIDGVVLDTIAKGAIDEGIPLETLMVVSDHLARNLSGVLGALLKTGAVPPEAAIFLIEKLLQGCGINCVPTKVADQSIAQQLADLGKHMSKKPKGEPS